uniref:Uncharacterized protein n=1 Tax=Timema shepardi TaxID=629360 RepID=A0A7R9FXQ1_TIMSH|nr:unnamed protein product [Timema shepardi]
MLLTKPETGHIANWLDPSHIGQLVQSNSEMITSTWPLSNALVDLTGRPDGGVLKLDRTRYRHDPYARYTGTSVKLPM